MKPDYDIEIDHYYFAFEYSDGELSSEKIDVNDDDDFISCLKDYSHEYEQNPDSDSEVFLTRTDFFNQEYDDDDDVIDEDFDEEYLVYVNLEDCTVTFDELNDFDRETLKDGFEHLEEKINKFLTELKQARADREKQQGQEFSLEQKQSKGRCR